MRAIAVILMVVGGGSIVTTLMGIDVEWFRWMETWGILAGWAIRTAIFLFGTMVWGFAH